MGAKTQVSVHPLSQLGVVCSIDHSLSLFFLLCSISLLSHLLLLLCSLSLSSPLSRSLSISRSAGVFVTIPLTACTGPLDFILHKGDTKDVTTDRRFRDVAVGAVWLQQGNSSVYVSSSSSGSSSGSPSLTPDTTANMAGRVSPNTASTASSDSGKLFGLPVVVVAAVVVGVVVVLVGAVLVLHKRRRLAKTELLAHMAQTLGDGDSTSATSASRSVAGPKISI